MDIYDAAAMLQLEEYEKAYKIAGYKTLRTSVKEDTGINEFMDLIKGKTVLVSGNSGAGKSTLINKLIPNLELKTSEISKSHQTGKHTTTFAEMFDLEGGAKIIDTPGIKGFGLVDIHREELSGYFVEFSTLDKECKFNNCMHINEPQCAVKAASEKEGEE